MDPIKHLQETLEESLMEMNKEAMKALAAQIAATVTQLQNGEPSKVILMWRAGEEPDAIAQFICDNRRDNYVFSVLMPTGRVNLDLVITDMEVVSLDLPQNKLLLYYYP
jgi:hypothetical protein